VRAVRIRGLGAAAPGPAASRDWNAQRIAAGRFKGKFLEGERESAMVANGLGIFAKTIAAHK
jgi:hypothetical protein